MTMRRCADSSSSGQAGNTDGIDPSSAHELHYWATQWGIAPERITTAIAAVGTNLRLLRRECAVVGELGALVVSVCAAACMY
ncbi:MAG: DUF3606 domain-containing protein [Rhodanobacteraceae bacterium]|nr:DUF3606 domain-containing protein [Rhodanobacteraceae bacterium]